MLARLAIGVGVAFAAWMLINKKKKVFVSYYYDGDRHYKNLLNAWSKNSRFDIEFIDTSIDVSVKSENKSYIRRKIAERIKGCDIFIVLVGTGTHKSEWVSWEIKKATECGKKIVAIKEKKKHPSPKELLSKGVTWVYGYNQSSIVQAFNE